MPRSEPKASKPTGDAAHLSRTDALYAADPAAPRSAGRVLATIAAVGVAIAAIFIGGDLLGRLIVYKAERARAGHAYPVTATGAARDLAINAYMASGAADVDGLLELGLPIYDLRVPAKELRAIARTADQVVAREVSLGVERNDHDAQLCLDGAWRPVRIKLRGLMAYHYNKNHFSFRLKLPKNGFVDGMRELNLLELYDKGLFVDPVTHATLADKGLMTLRDRYAVVRINGEVWGLYQEWEHFSRSLADRLGRPEGDIIGGDGQLFGKPSAAYEKAKLAMAKVQACLPAAGEPVRAECGWPLVSTYFDVDRLAWSAAMSALLHATHTWNPDNLRLFWDPAWGRFEPIPWDYSLYRLDLVRSPDGETQPRALSDLLLASGPLRRARDERLWRLLNDDVDAMIARAEAAFAAIAPALELDRRHLDMAADRARLSAYRDTLRHNAAALRALLERDDLHIAHQRVGRRLRLRVRNNARASAVLRAVVLSDGAELPLPEAPTPIVDGSWKGVPGEATFELALGVDQRAVAIRADNWITGAPIAAEQLRLGDAALALPQAASVSEAPWSPAIAGLRTTRDALGNATLHIGPGLVELRETLIVPDGVKTVLAPGTTLRLGADVSLLMHGDIEAVGTATAPIAISAIDPAHTFGTFALLGVRTDLPRVRLHHVHVKGGRGGAGARAFFTSAVSLHGAIIEVRDCTFLDAQSDDGVNFKNARVDIARMRIERSRDDSFDCDFCRGVVADSTIVQSGADGFDFSGSDVVLRGDRVQGCADKGFSIGEHTVATIIDADVERCTTGAASKDRSELRVQSGRFRRLRVGFAQYVKKATFGPSSLVVEPGVVVEQVQTPRLREVLGGDGQPTLCRAPVRGQPSAPAPQP